MVLILISWTYILFTTINLGHLLDRLLKTKIKDFATLSVTGLFLVTVVASTWAIFGRVNWEFHLFLVILNAFIFAKYNKDILNIYKGIAEELKQMAPALKAMLGIVTVLIIAQCSSVPYVIDNESYYIQTIKWINEYGFVKGLGNLHYFLAQSSGWHITQSALSFSFLYKNFNDLSGFCLLLGNLFSFIKLNNLRGNSNRTYLIIGLLPLANLFFFQFISAPSPDIPVYILSFIIFYYFLERYRDMDAETFTLIIVMALYILYIKTTAVIIILIPILLFAVNFRILLPKLLRPAGLSIVVLLLFVTKNSIISGYPLFPIVGVDIFDLDYKIPERVANLYYKDTKVYGFYLTHKQYEAMNAGQLFVRWLTMPKLHGLFNKLALLLLLISPVFIYKYFNRREAWILYVIMAVQMVMLYLSSPQYRFFMNFLLLFSFIIISVIISRKLIYFSLWLSIGLTAFVLFVPINLNNFTDNKFILESSNFSIKHIVYPHENSKLRTGYELIEEGNLKFYSPVENPFLLAAGDGPLPCVNNGQIKIFERKHRVLPQKRTRDLADGFYARETQVLLPQK